MKSIFLCLYLTVMSIYDWRRKSVPAVLLLLGGVIAAGGWGCSCVLSPGDIGVHVMELFFGMLPGSLLLLTAWVTRKIGWGDGVVMLIVGICMGYRTCMALLCFSLLLAAGAAAVLLLLRRADRHTTLPYLPFLAITYLTGIFI